MSRDELKIIYRMDRELLLKAKQLTIESQNSEIDTVVDMDKAIREAFVNLLEAMPTKDELSSLLFGCEDFDNRSRNAWNKINKLL